MANDNLKHDVLRIRMDSATLQLLERARQYVDLDRSKFIRQSIREKADAVIAAHEQTTCFNNDDWLRFFALLDKPPEPTERMKKAAALYQDIVSLHEL